MSKKQPSNQELIHSRISILFFYTLAMSGLLWLLQRARYRYDLIFRQMLPWLLPVALVLCVGGFVWCLTAARRQKEPGDKVFSPAFGAYLLVAPGCSFALLLLSYLGKGIEHFGLAGEASFYLLLGLFVAYILYYKAHNGAGLLCGGITLQVALVVYFYRRQLSPATGFLNLPEYGYLSPAVSALIIGLLVAGVSGVLALLGRVRRFRLPRWQYFTAAGLGLLYLVLTVLVPFSFTVRLVLLLVLVGLEVALLGVSTALLVKGKK